MKIKILEKKDKPMLYRQEVKLEVEFDDKVPPRSFLREQVAKALKVEKEMVIVDTIYSGFGVKKADVMAYVYTDKEKLEIFVPEYMKKRHAKEQKAEEKKEEPKAEVKPAEEKPKEEPSEQKAENSEAVKEPAVGEKPVKEAPKEKVKAEEKKEEPKAEVKPAEEKPKEEATEEKSK